MKIYEGMKLFVDDLRRPPNGWSLAKTNSKAIRLLATGAVSIISLDFDIANRPDETFGAVAYYLAAMNERPEIFFHTANIEAGRKMAKIIGCPFQYWWYEDLEAKSIASPPFEP